LDSIPGVGRRTAEIILAEIGTDMRRFPRAQHLASWTGMGPGKHERAGTRRSGKTRRGSPWLRWALIEVAQAAGRSKDTYVGAHYRRLTARLGKKKASVAGGAYDPCHRVSPTGARRAVSGSGGDLPGSAPPSRGRTTIGAPTGRVGVSRQARGGGLIYHIFMAHCLLIRSSRIAGKRGRSQDPA
jgi:hypothetical protein